MNSQYARLLLLNLKIVTAWTGTSLLAVASFTLAALRVTRFGPSLGFALAYLIVLSPIAAVTSFLAGASWPAKVRLCAACALTVAFVIGIEAYAGAQELEVVREYKSPCPAQTNVPRAHPFSNSVIFCGNDGRWYGND